MPYSETTELLPMPRTAETADAEEEDSLEPTIDPKIIEERPTEFSNRIFGTGSIPDKRKRYLGVSAQ